MKRNKDREEISEIVSRWRNGDLSRQEFCRAEHLSFCTFISWIKKIREQESAPLTKVVPLKIDGYSSGIQSCFEVEYPNGVRLRMSALPGSDELMRIIQIYPDHVFAQ